MLQVAVESIDPGESSTGHMCALRSTFRARSVALVSKPAGARVRTSLPLAFWQGWRGGKSNPLRVNLAPGVGPREGASVERADADIVGPSMG